MSRGRAREPRVHVDRARKGSVPPPVPLAALVNTARPTIVDRPAKTVLPRKLHVEPEIPVAEVEWALDEAEWSEEQLTPFCPTPVPQDAFRDESSVTLVMDCEQLNELLFQSRRK